MADNMHRRAVVFAQDIGNLIENPLRPLRQRGAINGKGRITGNADQQRVVAELLDTENIRGLLGAQLILQLLLLVIHVSTDRAASQTADDGTYSRIGGGVVPQLMTNDRAS